MKILGLVLELNPPHNGHKYFIDKAKEMIQPDLVIAIITTNFTMRGDISVIDKFTKTNIALELGIDIVIELPFLRAVQSADFFCMSAIKALNSMNVTHIAFGAELADIFKLEKMIAITKSDSYNHHVRAFLDKGYSYSTATNKAFLEECSNQEFAYNFSLPNNTLALQYLNGISVCNKEIIPTAILRIDNNYYDEEASSSIASATSIRNMIEGGENFALFVPKTETTYLPIDIAKTQENLFLLLKLLFIREDVSVMKDIFMVSEGIEHRLKTMCEQSKDYNTLIKNVETKRYNKSRIKRLILHLLLKTNIANFQNSPSPPDYLRILGMNELGKTYISTLPKKIKKQIFSSPKEDKENLIQEQLSSEVNATKLYGLITNNDLLYLNEYKLPIIKKEIGDK